MSQSSFHSFEEFWPSYVAHHSQFGTRVLHLIGFFSAAGLVLTAALLREPYFLLAAPLVAYGSCWTGHFFIEHDVPATFTHPFWSIMGFFKMVWLSAAGKMDDEVERCLYVRPQVRSMSFDESRHSSQS